MYYYVVIFEVYEGNYIKVNQEIWMVNKLGLLDEDMWFFLVNNVLQRYIVGGNVFIDRSFVWDFLDIFLVLLVSWIGGIILIYLIGIIFLWVMFCFIE